jgi:hypothetical protein
MQIEQVLKTLPGTSSAYAERGIVVPMIDGMISSTLLTLVVIPAIFGLIWSVRLRLFERPGRSPIGVSRRGARTYRSPPNERYRPNHALPRSSCAESVTAIPPNQPFSRGARYQRSPLSRKAY